MVGEPRAQRVCAGERADGREEMFQSQGLVFQKTSDFHNGCRAKIPGVCGLAGGAGVPGNGEGSGEPG